jgi:hypothetical protein
MREYKGEGVVGIIIYGAMAEGEDQAVYDDEYVVNAEEDKSHQVAGKGELVKQ